MGIIQAMGSFLTLDDQPGAEKGPHSEQDLARFKQEFELAREKDLLIGIPAALVLGFIALVLKVDAKGLFGPRIVWMIAFVAIVFGLFFFLALRRGCPACGAGFRDYLFRDNRCRSCGVELR